MAFHRVRQTANGENVYIVNESGKNRACHITGLRQGCGQSQMMTRQTRLADGELAQYSMKFYCQKTDRFIESHAEMYIPKRYCHDLRNLEQIKGQVIAKMKSWHRDAAKDGRHSPHSADDRDFHDHDGELRFSGQATRQAKRSQSQTRQSQQRDHRTPTTSHSQFSDGKTSTTSKQPKVRRSQSLVNPTRSSQQYYSINQLIDKRTGQEVNRYFMSARHYRACPISGEKQGCGSSRIMNSSTESRREPSIDFSVSFHCKANELGGVTHHVIVQVPKEHCSNSKLEQVEKHANQMIGARLSKGKCIGREDGAGRRQTVTLQIKSENISSVEQATRGRSRQREQPPRRRAYSGRRSIDPDYSPTYKDSQKSTSYYGASARFGGRTYKDIHRKSQEREQSYTKSVFRSQSLPRLNEFEALPRERRERRQNQASSPEDKTQRQTRPVVLRRTGYQSFPSYSTSKTGLKNSKDSSSKSSKPYAVKSLLTPNMLAALSQPITSSRRMLDLSSSEDDLPSTSQGIRHTTREAVRRGYQKPKFSTQLLSSEESDSD